MPLPPRDDRYFEDYHVGEEFAFGDEFVDQDEVIAFARRYDPQYIHTDPERAAAGPFGGLISSGWMTVGIMMRLLVEHFVPGPASLGSPGVDSIRWPIPVRPGDRLKVRLKIVEARRSRTKPDRGIVQSDVEVLNQHDQVVMTFRSIAMMLTRDPA